MTLKEAFRNRQIRQAEAAEHLGVSDATVSKWVNGHEVVPPRLMRPLAELLCVDLDTIVPPGELRRSTSNPSAPEAP